MAGDKEKKNSRGLGGFPQGHFMNHGYWVRQTVN
jgi:hypothetical protein